MYQRIKWMAWYHGRLNAKDTKALFNYMKRAYKKDVGV